ncbi:MAG: glyoxalase/bleomycin resistance/extradiol dioxygenase family protein [Deltaproteobacteria bacterium]|nr:glyoxalase/bleomycin resistance/extradiol dioxygenase family protein [Deltaproteobacteria bacterium]
MARTVKPIPRGYHTLTPALVVRDCAAAIEFYRKALGAEERSRVPGPDGKIMHAELVIGDSTLILADENPSMGAYAPRGDTRVPLTLNVYTDDARRVWQRAKAAGVDVQMELAEQFWGDLYGTFVDPYGFQWAIGQRVKDLTRDQIAKAQDAFFASQKA